MTKVWASGTGRPCRCVRFTTAFEKAQRINRRRVFANLEIKLGCADAAGLAGMSDNIAALDLIASHDAELFRVRIHCDVVVGVAYEHEIAEAREPVVCINYHAVLGRFDWGIFRHRDGEAIVFLAIRLGAKVRKDFPTYGPLKDRSGIRRVRRRRPGRFLRLLGGRPLSNRGRISALEIDLLRNRVAVPFGERILLTISPR